MKLWKMGVLFLITIALVACDNGNGTRDLCKNGHAWGEYTQTTQPTCTEKGIKTRACTRADCSAVDTITQEGEPALGHLAPSGTLATCTTDGNTGTGTCTRDGCDEMVTGTVIDALGHDWDWIETRDGVETKTCSICDETDGIRLTLAIGDTGPGGGIIFYLSETGFTMTDDNSIAHYLEAAPNDIPTRLAWTLLYQYNEGPSINTSEFIGTGRKNTFLILEYDVNAPAAKACMEYNNGNKTDWFLPSYREITELHKQRDKISNLVTSGDFWDTLYWTSTVFSTDYPSSVQFVGENIGGGLTGKRNTLWVRAIRAF